MRRTKANLRPATTAVIRRCRLALAIRRAATPCDSMRLGKPRRTSHGFTMLEVFLVIAIMIAVLAISWPRLQGSFRTQRLKKAAELIQAEWSQARNKAIRTGGVHVFQHTVHSNRFVTRVQASPEDVRQAQPDSDATSFTPVEAEYEELPQGVFFLGADVILDQRSSIEMSSLEETPVPDFSESAATEEMTGNVTWGLPVFFFPDGTTSTAQLVLANDTQQTIGISLRGLTGIARLGPVEAVSESVPGGSL